MEQHVETSSMKQAYPAADTFDSLPAVFRDRALRQPEEIACSQADARLLVELEMQAAAEAGIDFDPVAFEVANYPDPDESLPWREQTYQGLQQDVDLIAAGLVECGVERGVRAAILSNTRPEWMAVELGIMTAGGAVVTCYTSDPVDRIGFVLWDSGADVVFVENQEQLDKVLEVIEHGVDAPATELHEAGHKDVRISKIITFESVTVPEKFNHIVTSLSDLKSSGANKTEILNTSPHQAEPDDEATLIYTSGTTGAPKGVIATHRQHLANVRQIVESGIVDGIKRSFQLLPLAHGFGLQLLHVLVSHCGSAVFPRIVDRKSSALTDDVRRAIRTDMRDANADLIALVPKVLQGMKDKLLLESKKFSVRSKLLGAVIDTYTKVWKAAEAGVSPGLKTRILHAFFESSRCGSLGSYVKQQIKENMVGTDFKYFISGGAPLSEQLYDFFSSLDIQIYEGYGSTEANVPVSANRPGKSKKGTVGTPFDTDIKVSLSPEGELLVAGPNLAKEYNNRPGASAETWDASGQLHTRDRASIDEDGFITIKGRIDDLIVLSNGKNIEPEPIEVRMSQHPLVKDVMVAGHGRDCLIGLVVLDSTAVSHLMKQRGVLLQSELENQVAEEVRALANDGVEKKTEQLAAVLVIPEPTVGDGYTPTMKLQKKKIVKKYDALLDRFKRKVASSVPIPFGKKGASEQQGYSENTRQIT